MGGAALQGSIGEQAAFVGRGLVSLGVLIGILALAVHFGWAADRDVLLALGFLLIAGYVTGNLAALLRLPRLTGYLAAGVLSGPHVGHVVSHADVKTLSVVNTLALALIALEAGAELTVAVLKRNWRGLVWQSVTQGLLLGLGMAAVFGALAALGLFPFLDGLGIGAVIALSFVWGAIATSKSPAATLALLKETRAQGPVAESGLGVVVLFDVIVLVLFAVTMMFARATFGTGGTGSPLEELSSLGVELVASVAAGTTFGLAIAAYFALIGKERLVFVLTAAYGITAFCAYFHYDTLLVFAVAGFVVTNMTRQGPVLIHTAERMGSVVMVVFFATAGAHLDLDVLRTAWPVALALVLSRIALTWVASYVGHRLARDPEPVRKYAFTALISQAGVTIGLVTIAADALGEVGIGLATIAIATVGMNELLGPIIFKAGLGRAGELGRGIGDGDEEPLPPAANDEDGDKNPPDEQGHG